MPRKAKATEAEVQTAETTPEVARGGKTAAVKAALKVHPTGELDVRDRPSTMRKPRLDAGTDIPGK